MPIGGTSYQPGAMPGAGPQQPSAPSSPQEAVRILNLRLPQSPQNAPIPGQLLGAQGAGGDSLAGLLRALMAAFGGGQAPASGREMVGAGGPGIDTGQIGARPMPQAPRIRPGDTSGREELPPQPPAGPLFGGGEQPDIPGVRPVKDMPNLGWGGTYPLF